MRVVSRRAKQHYMLKFYTERIHECINVSVSLLQVVACTGFYIGSTPGFYLFGCYGFIFTSLINVVLATISIVESKKYNGLSEYVRGLHEREMIESVLYLIGNVCFLLGSVLFLPSVNEGESSTIVAGTTIFLVGSCAFSTGAFFNTLGVFTHRALERDTMTTIVSVISVFLVSQGAMAFVVGSWLFFPGFLPNSDELVCSSAWSTVNVGTNQYVIGASCFFLSAIANVINAHLKHRESIKMNKTTYEKADSDNSNKQKHHHNNNSDDSDDDGGIQLDDLAKREAESFIQQ